MGNFFFDESLHKRGEFILGSFVYSHDDDIAAKIFGAVTSCGMEARVDEFKSGIHMSKNPAMRELRDHLFQILFDCRCRVGVVVIPFDEREHLGDEGLNALSKFLLTNGLQDRVHEVYFDRGILPTKGRIAMFGREAPQCRLHLEQDSCAVPGIQLADLVAHTSSGMLLEKLGLVTKMVRAGENSGYSPDMEMNLGFSLWARLRYAFFCAPTPIGAAPGKDPFQVDPIYDVENYGLFISTSTPSPLREAAVRTFGKCYLGCIH